MHSLVLAEGIKGWVAAKGEFIDFMQEYDETKW
jgi:arsenical-resistance protein 2